MTCPCSWTQLYKYFLQRLNETVVNHRGSDGTAAAPREDTCRVLLQVSERGVSGLVRQVLYEADVAVIANSSRCSYDTSVAAFAIRITLAECSE